MRLYSGIDLHANSNLLAVIDQDGKRIFSKKISNDSELVLETLRSFKENIVGIAVESTYNWYWLVDSLMAKGYQVHLANPAGMQRYSGLKYSDDKHDAFWLAEMLRLNILPEGYIYPKEIRSIRDLLRKRSHLVRIRTSLIISLQNTIARQLGKKINVDDVKSMKEDRVGHLLEEDEYLSLAGGLSKETINYLTLNIREIERVVEQKVKVLTPYQYLLTLPGVGKILSLTIMLETGPIKRFKKVGHYVSYCRKVNSKWTSNGKQKGTGNRKSGNAYLAWAFSEAAEFARRYHQPTRTWYNRKLSKTNRMVAHNGLAHKLARAAYYIIRDQTPFCAEKLYG